MKWIQIYKFISCFENNVAPDQLASEKPADQDQHFFQLCLFVWFDSLRPSQQFSVMSGQVFLGWISTKQGLMCLAQGHNVVMPLRLEPAIPWSRVKHSTTEPLRSQTSVCNYIYYSSTYETRILHVNLIKLGRNVVQNVHKISRMVKVNALQKHVCWCKFYVENLQKLLKNWHQWMLLPLHE